MRIERTTLYLLRLPLIEPYKLALGTVEAFNTVLAVIEGTDGAFGYGEATILTGYTPETIEMSWATVGGLAEGIAGMETEDALSVLATAHLAMPFTASALASAVEMAAGSELLDVAEQVRVPLLAIVNAADEVGYTREIEARLEEGYGTLKVKVGFDAAADMARVRSIQRLVGGRALIRLDGNQGYGLEDAVEFAGALDPDGIELFEQPCAAGDWLAAIAVAEAATVPMMLDESIYGPDDIEQAAETGAARYVKLKLMKMGSIEALEHGLTRIRDLGMTPVLGNGVASDVGCWMEACVARRLIDNAGEMNGFLKPRDGIFASAIVVDGGCALLEPGVPALKDDNALTLLSRERVRIEGG